VVIAFHLLQQFLLLLQLCLLLGQALPLTLLLRTPLFLFQSTAFQLIGHLHHGLGALPGIDCLLLRSWGSLYLLDLDGILKRL
jgi:hypothetical protein